MPPVADRNPLEILAALRQREADLARAHRIGRMASYEVDLRAGQFRNRRSPEYLTLHGLPPESADEPHEAWVARLHPEDRSRADSSFRDAVLAGNREYTTRYRIIRPRDGKVRWIDVLAEIDYDPDGKPLRLFGTHTDVTERVEAEHALKESESLFRSFAEAIPDQVWTAPPDGLIDWCNARAHEYFGTEPGTLIGARWLDAVHPADLLSARENWQKSLLTGDSYQHEFRLRGKSGDFRWHLARAVPIRNDNGSITRWIGTNTDIHERKLAEDENVRDRNRTWTLSPVLKFIGAAEGAVHSVNPAWTSTLGWSEQESVGAELSAFVTPEERDQLLSIVQAATISERRPDIELTMLCKTGERRRVAWTFLAERHLLYGFGRDITEQRLAEDALRQSQKMEAVGQLTGGIAHDFNNLLQGIIGCLDLLQKRFEQGRADDVDKFLDGALQSAQRAASLTHRLLAFSRRQPLNAKAVNPNAHIASIEDLLRRTLSENIQLQLDCAPDLAMARCDPNQLENAVLNLAINARDAMPDGGILRISTRNTEIFTGDHRAVDGLAPGRYVYVEVSDTGTGMANDVVQRAFEPFFTTKPQGKGTGLGLSMIYGFARQSGGFAAIRSTLGIGTTVELLLPVSENLDECRTDLTVTTEETEDDGVILVVEDDRVVRDLVTLTLTDLGYRVIPAEDGPIGLGLLQSHHSIDLLVTDVGLPGLNGRQLADAARSVRPGLPVIFMSGYAEKASLPAGALEPNMDIIAKPFAFETLVDQVRKSLKRTRKAV